MTTEVVGGPLSGVTRVMTGGKRRHTKMRANRDSPCAIGIHDDNVHSAW